MDYHYLLTFRTSTGVSRMRATSMATLPWPRITAVSLSRSGCSWNRHNRHKMFLYITSAVQIRDLRIGRLRSNRIRIESKEMCGTTDSSFQCSNTLNNTAVWSLTELASLYTVPLSAVNGLSRLTTTSNGQERPIRRFSNQPFTFESNRISKLRRSLVQIDDEDVESTTTAWRSKRFS